MRFFRKYLPITLILLLGLLGRLYLATFGNHLDLIINAGWGEWIYYKGPGSFYTNSVWTYGWPTQLPLVNSVYSFDYKIFVKLIWAMTYVGNFVAKHHFWPNFFAGWFRMINWFGHQLFAQTPFLNGHLYSMKLLPIFSDIGLGLTIFLLGKKVVGPVKAGMVSLLFLLLPFGWYISSLWGQYDQLAAFLVLTSLLALFAKGKNMLAVILSAVMMFIALEIKPNLFPLAFLYLTVLFSQKQVFLRTIVVVGVAVIMFTKTTLPYTSGDLIAYVGREIIPAVFNTDRNGLANHTFNFWQFMVPGGSWATSYKLLGIKSLYWGIAALIGFVGLGVKTFLKNKTMTGLIVAVFIISGGSYIFGTGMVDRYYFLGVTSLGILTFYFPKLLGIWIASALVFSFNLFYSWGYPFLIDLNVWGDLTVVRAMSLIQTTLFIISVILINRQLSKVLSKANETNK